MLNRHSRTSFDARAAARASHKGGLMAESDQVKTGVVGLDAILGGGIPRGNVIVVEGPAGSGKTTLGLEFIYRGATDFGEPDRKSTRLNSSHSSISYAVFCLK